MTRTGSTCWHANWVRWRAASSAQGRLRRLHDNASDAIWRGSSADAFRDRIEKLPGHLAKLARSYQDAADGFTGYSAAVRQIAHDATLAQTEEQAAVAGRAWVGPNARLASDGKSWVSSDGLRVYRPPTYKPEMDMWQANFETKLVRGGRPISNGHLEIVDAP